MIDRGQRSESSISRERISIIARARNDFRTSDSCLGRVAHGLRACVMRSSARECNASIDVRACCAGSRTRSAFAPERTCICMRTGERAVHASARLNVGADVAGLPERSRMGEPSSRSGGEAPREQALSRRPVSRKEVSRASALERDEERVGPLDLDSSTLNKNDRPYVGRFRRLRAIGNSIIARANAAKRIARGYREDSKRGSGQPRPPFRGGGGDT